MSNIPAVIPYTLFHHCKSPETLVVSITSGTHNTGFHLREIPVHFTSMQVSSLHMPDHSSKEVCWLNPTTATQNDQQRTTDKTCSSSRSTECIQTELCKKRFTHLRYTSLASYEHTELTTCKPRISHYPRRSLSTLYKIPQPFHSTISDTYQYTHINVIIYKALTCWQTTVKDRSNIFNFT